MIKRIKTGNRVEIGLPGSAGYTGDERRKVATLVEVVREKEVLVLMPMVGGHLVELPEGKQMEARFYTESSVLHFDVTVVDHPQVERIRLTRLRLDSEGERIQLRDFYRVNSAVSFHFTLMAEQVRGGGRTPEIHTAITKDLSGGGMCFLSDLLMENNTKIFANFSLGGEYIVAPGRVFNRENASGGNYKYMYRCQFSAISAADQEKIVQFVQSLQLKTLQ